MQTPCIYPHGYLWIYRVVFLVGTAEVPEVQKRIDRESSTYMDIVQVREAT